MSAQELKAAVVVVKKSCLLFFFRNDKGEGGKGRFLLGRLRREKKRSVGEVRGKRPRVEVKGLAFNLGMLIIDSFLNR